MKKIEKFEKEAEKIANVYHSGAKDRLIVAIREALQRSYQEGRKEIEKELMCELRDPNGTIWENARFLQDKLDALEKSILNLSHPNLKLMEKEGYRKGIEDGAKVAEEHKNRNGFGQTHEYDRKCCGGQIANKIKELLK